MIRERYTLFTRVPLYLGADGTVWADNLWQKDLSLHLTYIEDFRICCPVLPDAERPAQATQVDGLHADRVTGLRQDRGWGSVLRNLVPNFRRVARAARATEIAHSGGAGWAFPLSYYLLALRPFTRFRWVMVIESSFWMKPAGRRASLRETLSHHLHGALVRACLRAADAHIVTQAWYRDVLIGPGTPVHVAPAVWIDAGDVVTEDALAARPERGQGPARLIFPARLEPEKGVETVLAAIETYAAAHAGDDPSRLAIDIMGQGSLAERARDFAAQRYSGIDVRFVEPVPYGAPFFAKLAEYEGVIVANLQSEQPRILFDAFAQGLPVLTAKTPGTETLCTEGETGWLFAPGDAAALADLFDRAVAEPGGLRAMGQGARAAVVDFTHDGMHRRREVFLRDRLALP